VSEVDDCVLCLYEWNEWLDTLPEMDIIRVSKRQSGFYLILLEDSTLLFDMTDWDAAMSLALKDLKDC